MMGKKVLVFCQGIDKVLSGSSDVAGIQVQMSLWAEAFVDEGWRVFSIADQEPLSMNGIEFIEQWRSRIARHCPLIIKETIDCLVALRRTRPDLLLFRGASRYTFSLVLLCRLFKTRFVFLSASDTDFEIGSEIVSGSPLNVMLYRKSIRHIPYIVTQNIIQATKLRNNYDRESIIIPNIWHKAIQENANEKRFDVVWVANLHAMKRVEWFIALAAKMPNHKFAIIGGRSKRNVNIFDETKSKVKAMPNVAFLGAKPLAETNSIIAQSRLLVCTSEFEGFPNTFLQAWSSGVPVVSTVNPNNVVTDYNLGRLVLNEQELYDATTMLLNDTEQYNQCKGNINRYFDEHHSAETAIDRLLHTTTCKP
ncbi:MAG: glycosyltransferase [Paludibacteraceae bacterium]|nr:glycosyltransferase [Paludibacteraceae bacterium]